ncbi:protein serine/threonine phosphatase 2C [Penicillium lagena]|uniref:protein serine/threonine phosphatase 2C n=1 Tax=Penicillium lagena TaxID=94218 RepID=UPI00253F75F7|nr:protein serine/threonine phosphatase 2C [Penicillium lagena]KAJ5619515.1 protein serine/threonine phosphatase 2C [Penicillium lagena]
MLSLGVSRAGLGRAASSVGRTYSTNSAKHPPSNRRRNVALASVISTMPGLWWFTATDDNIPLLKTTPVDHWDVEPGPSKDQVTRMISEGAYSFPVKSVAGISRYDGTQLGSNSLCEDRFTHGKLPSPWDDGSQWMAWAIFDGHAGWQTADLLEKQLLPFVRHSLNQVKPSLNDETVSSDLVQRAIIKGFLNLDDSIIKTALRTAQSKEPLSEKVKKLMPAFAGSCALLSLYDPSTRSLHVACTGDSRAVLGQQLPNGTWEAIPLSVDQTGSNQEEIARLYKEHPGEKEIVKEGRVLGVMVSRAFGDSRWKWPLDFQQEMKERFFGPSPLTPKYDVRTPPYLTAEPVVTTTKIDPGRPSFLIMASDGLWDSLSSQQAVDLVGKWIGSRKSIPAPEYEAFDFGQGVSERFVEGRTTVQDGNSAVHLVRNSLGGNHHEMIAGRLAFSPPFSRHPRDDITVQVVFFNTPV